MENKIKKKKKKKNKHDDLFYSYSSPSFHLYWQLNSEKNVVLYAFSNANFLCSIMYYEISDIYMDETGNEVGVKLA